jgi:2-polyprenyl-6-methoxyphenol hydroxylase-like FAD-dependent oxidoreductase
MSNKPIPLKIAIIGAGPSGCTLALLLLQSSLPISITIFESESSPNIRSQGGTLDLHKDTGLAAIRDLGLYNQVSLTYYQFKILFLQPNADTPNRSSPSPASTAIHCSYSISLKLDT